MEQVSLIITVYNLEACVEGAVRSLMAQTYPALEIICVDDGSTDGSPAILARLAAQDARIRIITKENGGVGAARNDALAVATGTYVMILDGDDMFEPRMVERLVACIERKGAGTNGAVGADAGKGAGAGADAGEGEENEPPIDFVVCRADQFDDTTHAVRDLAYSIRMEQIPAHDPFAPTEMADYVFSAFVGWPWDKLYRREFLLRENLTFPSLKNSEDLYFTFLSIALARRISVCDEVLIHYRNNRKTSLSGSRVTNPDEFYHAICMLKARLQASPSYPRLEWGFLNWALDYTLWNIITLPQSPQRSELIRRLMTGDLAELELARHGKEYFGLFPRSAMNYDLLRAEFEGKPAPAAGVEDASPRLGLVAQALTTAHHFGWGAAKWQFDEWKARRAVAGSDVTAIKATQRGRSYWKLSAGE